MNQPAVQFMLAPHLKNAMRSASRSQNNGVKSCNSTFFHAMHLAWRVPWDSNLPAVFTTAPRRAIAGPHANGYYAPARLPWAVCCSCQTGSPCGSSRCRILREIADCVGDSAVAAPASELGRGLQRTPLNRRATCNIFMINMKIMRLQKFHAQSNLV